MPYKKIKAGAKWKVVKEDDESKVFGTHDTEKEADDQLAALYANEPESEAEKVGKPADLLKIADAGVFALLQEQHTMERTNEAIYHSLASGLAANGWVGFSAWMERAAADEAQHAGKITEYLVDREVGVVFESLPATPLINSTDPADYYNAALERELATTRALTAIYVAAWNAVDMESCVFLHWFFPEQTTSTAEIVTILQRLAAGGEAGRVVLDIELGRAA